MSCCVKTRLGFSVSWKKPISTGQVHDLLLADPRLLPSGVEHGEGEGANEAVLANNDEPVGATRRHSSLLVFAKRVARRTGTFIARPVPLALTVAAVVIVSLVIALDLMSMPPVFSGSPAGLRRNAPWPD